MNEKVPVGVHVYSDDELCRNIENRVNDEIARLFPLQVVGPPRAFFKLTPDRVYVYQSCGVVCPYTATGLTERVRARVANMLVGQIRHPLEEAELRPQVSPLDELHPEQDLPHGVPAYQEDVIVWRIRPTAQVEDDRGVVKRLFARFRFVRVPATDIVAHLEQRPTLPFGEWE